MPRATNPEEVTRKRPPAILVQIAKTMSATGTQAIFTPFRFANHAVMPKLHDGAPSWTTSHSTYTTRRAPGAVRYSGILIYGGFKGDEPTDEVLLYDYALGDSQDAEKMSMGRDRFAYAADGAGRVYAIGGRDESGDSTALAERYSPSDDAWNPIASLPEARSAACAVAVDDDVGAFGGA